MARRTRTRFDDWELIDIVRARFRPLSRTGRLEELKYLAGVFERDQAQISHAISSAFRRGLVEVRVIVSKTPPIVRNDGLEKDILRTFPSLASVHVIHAAAPRVREMASLGEYSDRVHRMLGRSAAAALYGFLEPRSTFAISGGRGVYYALDALQSERTFDLAGVSLVSTTGTVAPRTHGSVLNVLMDADVHLGFLGKQFRHHVSIYPIANSIVPDNVDRVRASTVLSGSNFRKRSVSHALVGVGVLWHGHRFYEWAKEDDAGSFMGKLPIDMNELIQLVTLVRKSAPTYFPVGDVCNRLFFIPPYAEAKALDLATERRIKKLISKINSQLLTITDDQLAQIGTIIVVAGTVEKAGAIHQLLRREARNVRHLFIDSQAAARVLDLSRVVDR